MSGHGSISQPPRSARTSSRTSGEGPPVAVRRVTTSPRATLAGQLLRHSLVSPEKKTLKRIEAARGAALRGEQHLDDARAAIAAHLRADRGLASALDDEAFDQLTIALLDAAQLATAAATIVGRFLRAAGGIERSAVTPERVKAALVVVNDALYDLDHPNAPIPAAVREAKIERRDGGLQLIAWLRHGADDDVALAALKALLKNTGYGDIDVRTERSLPPVTKPRVPSRPRAGW